MSVLTSLFTDSFDIKKTIYQTTSGKATKVLSTVSTGNKGRFEAQSGGLVPTPAGRINNASHLLFTNINNDLEVGQIVVDEDDIQYDVISIQRRNFFATGHHLEVSLDQRNKVIS